MKKTILLSLILSSALVSTAISAPQKPSMAPLCKGCHQTDSNMVRGTLDYFVEKTKTFQLDLSAPGAPAKEVLFYDQCTKVKNLEDITEMGDYKGRAFRVYYYETPEGKKIATLITRFDILKTIAPEDKLDKDGLKSILTHDRSAILIDARPPMAYKAGYIPGAIVIPAAELEKHVDKLPKDKNTTLIFYCVGGCSSPTAAIKAKSLGYKNVKIYAGGFPDWISSEISYIDPELVDNTLKQNPKGYIVIDTNNPDVAKKAHLPNAVNVTPKNFEEMSKKLPSKKLIPIVVYGENAVEIASKLINMKYKGTRVLPITISEWKKKGYQTLSNKLESAFVVIPTPKPGTIAKDEFEKIIQQPPADTIIIDVRTKQEYEAGHFPNSINIPIEDIPSSAVKLPKDKTIIVSCATGVRAEMAYNQFKDLGFKVKYLDAVNKFTEDGGYEINPN
ncbi:rhodanese-like domain-containing protein [Calditerrivibrio sp.]|uniref:rhodanese-like domain-containing protein n=1 Tax=Calditerrivibrio sp. TaxID=2792612 RepID=UPI003D0DE5E8